MIRALTIAPSSCARTDCRAVNRSELVEQSLPAQPAWQTHTAVQARSASLQSAGMRSHTPCPEHVSTADSCAPSLRPVLLPGHALKGPRQSCVLHGSEEQQGCNDTGQIADGFSNTDSSTDCSKTSVACGMQRLATLAQPVCVDGPSPWATHVSPAAEGAGWSHARLRVRLPTKYPAVLAGHSCEHGDQVDQAP